MRKQIRRSKNEPKAGHQPETLGPARIITEASGKEIKQYPAHVRRHGTDAESKLNPEE